MLGYLPQTLPLTGDLTVAEVLGVAAVIAALDAIESGDASEEHFATIGDDWDIEERTRAQLDRLGLGDAVPRPAAAHAQRRPGRLPRPGGAAAASGPTCCCSTSRPTTSTSTPGTSSTTCSTDWTGCLLLVSHDRELLDRMDRIAELDRGEVRCYGGNFTAYEAAVQAEQEVAEKNVRNAEQEVKREKREMQQARERAERRASNAARNLKNAGLPRIFAGT